MFCQNCGSENSIEAKFCEKCGNALISHKTETSNETLHKARHKISIELLIQYFGKNSDYYIKKYNEIKSGRKVSFNFPAFFVGPLWFAYRKMYSYAISLWIINLIIPYVFLIYWNNTNLFVLTTLIIGATCASYANYIYINFINKKIDEIESISWDPAVKIVKIESAAGVSVFGACLLLTIGLIFSVIVFIAIGNFSGRSLRNATVETKEVSQISQTEDECVNNKTTAFKKEMGDEALVRSDMIEEWKIQCADASVHPNSVAIPQVADDKKSAQNTRNNPSSGEENKAENRIDAISECMIVTYNMASFQKTFGTTEAAAKLFNFSSTWGETAVSIGKRYGYTEDQVILLHKKWFKFYESQLDKIENFTEEWSTTMQNKMKSCTELLKSDEEISEEFRRIHNNY